MAATGKEKLYVSQNGGGRSTLTAQEIADLAGGGGGAVSSVNSQTGEVVLDAEDVGALPAPDGAVPAYSDTPADLADALVRAGLMQAE